MAISGWICLHRDIKDHWIFNFEEPDKFMAWCDLILSANHEDKKFMIKGRLVECKRGQVAMSQITLQKRWNMSQNKLKRFLVLLKNDGMIDFEANELTTIITICNYSKYQNNERADERADERPVERGTDDQSNDKQQLNNITIKQDISTNVDIDKKTKRFVSPTLDDVISFQFDNLLPEESVNFFNYYESNGWMVGKNKMKDWRAAFRGWCGRKNQFSKNIVPIKQSRMSLAGIDYNEGVNSDGSF